MTRLTQMSWILVVGGLVACDGGLPTGTPVTMEEAPAEAADERGPNNGRLLRDGDFVVELAIVETGVPPEFRAWVTDGGRAVDPEMCSRALS